MLTVLHILSKAYYDKHPESSSTKSAARSKTCYDKDLEKSCADSAACTKAFYDKDPESGTKSTARSKACMINILKRVILTVLHALRIIMKRI